MKYLKQCLLFALSSSAVLSIIPALGAPIEIAGFSMFRRMTHVAAVPYLRSYSNAFQGKYVSANADGVVRITQPKYPKYTGVQHLLLNRKIISPLMIARGPAGYEIPYHLTDGFDGPFEQSTRIESIVDLSVPFTIINSEEVEKKPYSSIGRLEVFFPKGDKDSSPIYYGSGAALDKNLVITAAHNFLPPDFNDHPNTGRIRAEEVKFHHMLTTARVSNKDDIRSARISTHCFIHPEWEKNFNPAYDVALLFLSESLKLTQKEVDELLKLKILNGKEETLRIVGHPNGVHHMSESVGKARWEQTVDSEEIIYHLVNTLSGSSGSPILSEDLHIIGTHTRGAGIETNGANSGVRMRLELLPFIDHSIGRHQEFLDNVDQVEEWHEKERKRKEQVLIDKGIEQGLLQGKMTIARNLKSMNFSLDQIKLMAGLTDDEMRELNS